MTQLQSQQSCIFLNSKVTIQTRGYKPLSSTSMLPEHNWTSELKYQSHISLVKQYSGGEEEDFNLTIYLGIVSVGIFQTDFQLPMCVTMSETSTLSPSLAQLQST